MATKLLCPHQIPSELYHGNIEITTPAFPLYHLCTRHNSPGTNLVVRVTREQSLTIRTPRQTHTVWFLRLLALLDVIGLEFVDLALLLEIEDGDGRGSSSAKPVSVGREDQSVNLVACLERVEVFRLVQIPEHGGTIFAARCAKRAIGRDGDGVDVAGVTDVVGLNTAGSQFPNLDQLIPTCAHNDGILRVGGESDARDPIGMALIGDREFAVSQGVPQLDGSVSRARHNLSVVGGEGHGKDVVGVADKRSGGVASGELPQAQGLVPRGGQGIGTVRGNDTVGNDVRVAVERSLGVSVGSFVASQVPDDQTFVSRTRQQHVRVFQTGRQTSDPATVAFEGTTLNELLSHGVVRVREA